jgi:two-component sensor histidine kinase
MRPDDPPKPIVEAPPAGAEEAEVSRRALGLRIRQQEKLAELGVAALKGLPLAELLNLAVHLAAEGLEAEFCKVLEYIPSEKRLLMRAGVGWHSGLVGTASVGADLQSPSGFALHTGKPVISNHLESEERFRTPELLAAHSVHRAMNVILQGDGAPFGVLEVDSRSEGEFGEHDIAFLQGAANILGMAIERQRREQALAGALELQKVLVREINHRVKNSLQLVASMLNLQAGEAPELATRLQEASSRIMAIGRAHERLYRGPQIERIDIGGYLRDVCSDLQELFPDCDIVLKADASVFLNTDQAIGLALVVSEIVRNAARRPRPSDGRGAIHVHIERSEIGVTRVRVREQAENSAVPFRAADQSGLGMRLAQALATQSGARFAIEQQASSVEFVLEIPPGQEGETSAPH